MVSSDQLVANVRAALLEKHGPIVQRERRFDVALRDPMIAEPAFDDPRAFVERYERVLRPLLERAERCRLIMPVQRGTVEPVGLYEEWRREGARPEYWMSRYIRVQGKGGELRLTAEVVRDQLFWWWLIPGRSGLYPVLLLPLVRLDAPFLFARTYDPQYTRFTIKGKSALATAFGAGKAETARSDRVAIVLHPNLTAWYFARAANVVELFRTAVAHARISPRLSFLGQP